MISIDIQKVLNTGISLSTETNRNKLLELIITEAMEISHADAGTLYVYCDEEKSLNFKIMRNNTMKSYQGGDGAEVNLPAVPMSMENVCSRAALIGNSINIPDVYNCKEFDLSGPKRYDSITGYHTKSMLVIPFKNTRGETLGVLQLINAQDGDNNVIPFSKDLDMIITSLASQAAIAMTNSMYLEDIKELFQSFVKVMITAIDEMTPYNVNHTKKIVGYVDGFIDYLNSVYRQKYHEFFDDTRREQLIMATWMHDIGKLITPIDIMNKETRLDKKLDSVLIRFDIGMTMYYVSFLEGNISKLEYIDKCKEIEIDKKFVERINRVPYLNDDDLDYLKVLKDKKSINLKGMFDYYINDEDFECLSIRRGTLTDKERLIMQTHAVLTKKLLDNIRFGNNMKDVPTIAAMHHEYLDGTGYPNGITAEKISIEARILSILDIFEALTSADRPYKRSMTKEGALTVLDDMAKEGKLDTVLVELFAENILNK